MERKLQEVEAEVEAAMAKLIGMTEHEEQAQEQRHNVQNEEEKIAKQIRELESLKIKLRDDIVDLQVELGNSAAIIEFTEQAT